MRTISVVFDPRSFVVGISNYTLSPYHWSWTAYFGPVFVQLHVLKPRRFRKTPATGDASEVGKDSR